MLLNVQMLRAVAALLVVFVHLEKLGELSGLPKDATFFGNSGVDLFFVISGMIMVMTTARPGQTPGGFLRNRVARIVPLYWTITLAVFAIALIAPALMQSTTADPVQLAKSLAFIPFQRADGTMHPTVFVGWTLNYEMAFYVLFAAGLALPSRALGLALTCTLLVMAVALGRLLHPSDPVLAFYAQPVILEFGAGMLLGAWLPKVTAAPAWRWPAAVLGLIAFTFMLAGPVLLPGADRAGMFGIPAVVIVASAVVAERGGLKADAGWIQLLGAASYAMYLTHFFCTQVVVKLAERLAGPLSSFGPAAMLLFFPLAFVLVAMAGILAHRRLELPLTEVARRALALSRPPHAPVVAVSPPPSRSAAAPR